ncbi:hypothetical protein CsSME_00029749 [Camellia sinensis var. sinensis]
MTLCLYHCPTREREKGNAGDCDGNRSSAGSGHSDVLQCPSQTPVHEASLGTCGGYGIGGCVRNPTGQVGRSASARPRQDAPQSQGRQ